MLLVFCRANAATADMLMEKLYFYCCRDFICTADVKYKKILTKSFLRKRFLILLTNLSRGLILQRLGFAMFRVSECVREQNKKSVS